MTTNACECCGSRIDVRGDVIWNAAGWTITTPHGHIELGSKLQAGLFDLLWHHRASQVLTGQRILDIVYADDPDGGPDTVHAAIHLISRLRIAIAPLGLRIIGGTKLGQGYKLASASPDVAIDHVINDRDMRDWRKNGRRDHQRPVAGYVALDATRPTLRHLPAKTSLKIAPSPLIAE